MKTRQNSSKRIIVSVVKFINMLDGHCVDTKRSAPLFKRILHQKVPIIFIANFVTLYVAEKANTSDTQIHANTKISSPRLHLILNNTRVYVVKYLNTHRHYGIINKRLIVKNCQKPIIFLLQIKKY